MFINPKHHEERRYNSYGNYEQSITFETEIIELEEKEKQSEYTEETQSNAFTTSDEITDFIENNQEENESNNLSRLLKHGYKEVKEQGLDQYRKSKVSNNMITKDIFDLNNYEILNDDEEKPSEKITVGNKSIFPKNYEENGNIEDSQNKSDIDIDVNDIQNQTEDSSFIVWDQFKESINNELIDETENSLFNFIIMDQNEPANLNEEIEAHETPENNSYNNEIKTEIIASNEKNNTLEKAGYNENIEENYNKNNIKNGGLIGLVKGGGNSCIEGYENLNFVKGFEQFFESDVNKNAEENEEKDMVEFLKEVDEFIAQSKVPNQFEGAGETNNYLRSDGTYVSKANENDESEILDNVEAIEYEIEKVVTHIYDDNEGCFKYLIKWQGYSDRDSTWEPVENLENGTGELKKYWLMVKRTHWFKNDELNDLEYEESIKYVPNQDNFREYSVALNYAPTEVEDWNEHLEHIKQVYKDEEGNTNVLIAWEDGNLTCHNIKEVANKIPLKLIEYFEKEIVFVSAS